ncbi:MAG: transketolase [Patescibacteria group bacterium]
MDERCINTIRMLAVDAVEKAQSGHPGMPMGAAPMAHVLWTRFLRHNPKHPLWLGRDRFVLSAGHGSMLLYSLLHLTGYDLSLADLKKFRQWGSRTPGHPEFGLTPGVETTTGPLGQGFANAVGMALAQKVFATRYHRGNFRLFDYFIYTLVSDGDLMEGITSEAASFAGSLKLGKLIALYDENHISIDGSTELTFTEDVAKRFEAYGWHVQRVANGNDVSTIECAIQSAKKNAKPSLILIRTHIAEGSPHKHDMAEAHGSPLGKEEVAATKRALGWPLQAFVIPPDVRAHFRQAATRGRQLEKEWQAAFRAYAAAYPALAEEIRGMSAGKHSSVWEQHLPKFSAKQGLMATRQASGEVLNAIAQDLPLLFGGSADLTPSNNTTLKKWKSVSPAVFDRESRNFHFGVREHAMGGMLNGMALSGMIPYGGTFFIFSDYMRAAMRLAAIMKLRVIYVLTHDSVGLGEDGTTHQPVEHLASFRAMPGMTVIRPADANETVEAWRAALKNSGPTILALTRQKVPVLDRAQFAPAKHLSRGAYILKDSAGVPELILIASGSEVALALDAAEKLAQEGLRVRVVSMPSWELFGRQTQTYQQRVLPQQVTKRIAIEAGSSFGWERYVGSEGAVIAMDRFGVSAPAEIIFEKFGFTAARVVATARKMLKKP